MIECVMLDTLPEKANLILNILWDRSIPYKSGRNTVGI